jgi:hypothetical protein
VITVRKLLPKRLTRVGQSWIAEQAVLPPNRTRFHVHPQQFDNISLLSDSLDRRRGRDRAQLWWHVLTAFYGSCVMERATMPAPRLVRTMIASSDECAFTGTGRCVKVFLDVVNACMQFENLLGKCQCGLSALSCAAENVHRFRLRGHRGEVNLTPKFGLTAHGVKGTPEYVGLCSNSRWSSWEVRMPF